MVERESEGGEWRVVRRGRVERLNLHSERRPVRHSYYPNHRYTQTNPSITRFTGRMAAIDSNSRIGGFASSQRDQKVYLSEENSWSFLFKNFPENCNPVTLNKMFDKVGEVVDVYWPKKRDKTGKLFGFVRFSKKHEEWKLLEDLNNIWLGSYKLRAFIPRFRREPLPPKTVFTERKSVQQEKKSPVVVGPVSKIDGNGDFLTFAEAIQGIGKDKPPFNMAKEPIMYNSSDSEKRWLAGCFTGFLKREFSWSKHKAELINECGGNLLMTPMGGNLLLVQSSSEKPTNEAIVGFNEWSAFWFDWIRPWRCWGYTRKYAF